MKNGTDFLFNILCELEIAILLRESERLYTPLSRVPEFYMELYPTDNGKPCAEPWKHSDLLAFFLEEVELFFSRDVKGQISSGIWQEEGVHSNKALMAHAINMGKEKLIIVRRLGDEYMDRVRILRKARENLLERRNLNTKIERYKRIARYDALTGLINRATFMEILKDEIERASETQAALSLLMLDIDDFKKVNDNYGHVAGDNVLSALGQLLNSQLRSHDIAARYGGEEFVVLSPGTGNEQAFFMAEKLRKKVENHPFSQPERLTISIGCTTYKTGESLQEFFERADFALYDAKRSNKNNVKVR